MITFRTMGTDSLLLVLQACSMGVSFALCLILLFVRFVKPNTTKLYENIRFMLASAMLLLGIHYALQMIFGFRAQGDDVGALINILFYSPVIYIVAYSNICISTGRSHQRHFLRASFTSLTLILSCFMAGYIHYGSLHMPIALYAMSLLFLLTVIYFIIYPMKEVNKVKRKLDEELSEPPVSFNLFVRTSVFLLNLSACLTTISIFYTPILAVIGPLILCALDFYVMSFLSLGPVIRQVKNVIVEPAPEKVSLSAAVRVEEEARGSDDTAFIGEHEREMVSKALAEWKQGMGYAQSELNSAILAVRLNIPKRLLVQYLREVEGATFRVWLSNVRVEAAKELILQHPEYSNEAVAEACGFSRNYLQAKFKESTGLTPSEWRDAHLSS